MNQTPHFLSPLESLRESSRVWHEALDKKPFVRAWSSGDVHPLAVLDFLEGMFLLSSSIEQQLSRQSHPLLEQIWTEQARRSPLLKQDLLGLRPADWEPHFGILGAALTAIRGVLERGHREPLVLGGCLYVLLGSRKGAPLLAPVMERLFQKPQNECASYFVSSPVLEEAWDHFEEGLNKGASEDDLSALKQGAKMMFEAVQEFADLVMKPRPSMVKVSSLNPEAGTHRIPSDPVKIEVAIEAGHRCLQEMPYIARHFGPRGERFTMSDSAWLCGIALHQNEGALTRQCQWLERLLTPRGVPSWCLERHLLHLGECAAATGREEDLVWGQRLTRQAQRMLEERQQLLPEETLQEWLTRYADHSSSDMVPILTSAWLNEKQGMGGGYARLKNWFLAPEHWEVEDVSLVEGFLQELEQTSPKSLTKPSSSE